MNIEEIRARYRALLGEVPENINIRFELSEKVGRVAAFEAIEAFRFELLNNNSLDKRTQQIVHFAMLIGAGEDGPARLHAKGALRAGATISDLFGVCETAAVVGGMSAFSRSVEVVSSVIQDV